MPRQQSTPPNLWRPWQPLPSLDGYSPAIVYENLCGGQSFHWWPHRIHQQETLLGIWQEHTLALHHDGQHWQATTLKSQSLQHTLTAWQDYWGDEKQYQEHCQQLPWRSDHILQQAMQAFPGLRILRQPLGETLLSFLLSSSKQIPHIQQICQLLRQRFGREIAPGLHRLPTWQELHHIPENELRDCRMGYRAKYLKGTAAHLHQHPHFLSELTQLPYSQAKTQIQQLPGVGSKIADCTLLFSGHYPCAFPVDTWIAQALEGLYSLENWNKSQLEQFGQIHYGPQAGLAQQFLFSYIRKEGYKGRKL